jgi:hypothetical protein
MKERHPHDPLLDILHRRPLSREEEALLRQAAQQASQETIARYEAEQELSRLIERFPDSQLPRGFTSNVLAALDRPAPVPGWWPIIRPFWLPSGSMLPRLAAAALVVLFPFFYLVHRSPPSGDPWAVSVASIAGPVRETGLATRLPPIDVFQDFDAIDQIRRLSALADEDLLVSLE